jgi:heme/copper-type cytochrome/quinol oxidase subunit 1
MVNAWVLPIAMLVLVYAFVGALLALFWVITRLAYRPARRYWQLPLRTWSILTTGFIMLAICVLIFTGAVYVSFLPAQTFSVMLTVLLVLGSMGPFRS